MQIVERIKDTASQQGYTLSELEQHLGFGVRTIYKWDKNAPSVEKVMAVANFLKVSLNWLVTGNPQDTSTPEPFLEKYNSLSKKDKERIDHYIEICQSDSIRTCDTPSNTAHNCIPVFGGVTHPPAVNDINVIGDCDLASDADFIFIMCDQSMFPLYSFNDRLYVRQVDHLNHGEIGIVLYDHQILCRQYIVSDQEIILRPFNTNFPELAFSNDDETTLKPIGKVLTI
ncbi:MAG: LexA family transcriptional regulator [Lachnospiraceae bacterium]|nr:LexA family transcriptional regulator [Lachnospiraceae bacterium]